MGINVQKLKGKITEEGLSQGNVATLIGIDRSTFYRKMKDDGRTFDIEEVGKIVEVLSLDKDETMNIFFAKQGT